MSGFLELSLSYGGSVLFVVVLAEQAGLPIPAAPCLLAAGALCANEGANPATALGATLLGCLVADVIWFFIGRRGGRRIFELLCRVGLFQPASVARTEQRFLHYGMIAVSLAKFVPGLSVMIPPLAGAVGIRLRRFLVFDSLGALVYAGSYLLLGATFRDQVETILEIVHEIGLRTLLGCFAVFIVAMVLKRFSRRRDIHRTHRAEKIRVQNLQPICSA